MESMEDFIKRYTQFLIDEEKEELANHANEIESFKAVMKNNGIDLNESNFKYHQTIGVVAIYPNIINYLQLPVEKDKDNLFDFENLKTLNPSRFWGGGLFGIQNCILMAHSYFRRGYHFGNNFSPHFIDLFWRYNDSSNKKYIAIDPDRVRLNMDRRSIMELDTWYGAKFNKAIHLVSDGLVKLRPPAFLSLSDLKMSFGNAYSLDIKWSTKGTIKTFQALEFKNDNETVSYENQEFFPVRYVHAEFDLERNSFRHFDGAMHLYSQSEYYARRDSDFNYNSKNNSQIKALSQKMFKINGNVSIDTWQEFTSHFLSANPLIFEYFEGKYPDAISSIIEKIKAKRGA